MQLLDHTFPTPEENLACDEVLLDWAESTDSDEILRFWTPTRYFVVLGYANRLSTHVNEHACRALGIPILRRCSGGGTVLQGPGCLNYALILRIHKHGPTANTSSTNEFIMHIHRSIIETLLKQYTSANEPVTVTIEGHTDLAWNGLKFSGNAQRRRKRFLLFHGTFLLHMDLQLVEQTLPIPAKQPAYRMNRSHTEFLVNLPIPQMAIKSALATAWHATIPVQNPPMERIQHLAISKYASFDWVRKFQ